MLRLGMLSNRVRAAGTDSLPKISDEPSSRAQIDALAAWTAAANQAIVVMLSTSNADTTIRLSRLRSDFADAGNRQRAAREHLSPALIQAIDPLERTFAEYGRGAPNIFDVRTAQLAAASAVRGALLDTKEAATRFVESADRVVGDVQKDARAQSDYFSSVIVDYSRVFAVLSLLCVLGAAGVFIYINRSVISRLQMLSDNMGQEIDILMTLPAATLTFSAPFIAEDAGFYRKEGLKVSHRTIAGVGAVNAVIAGSADFTMLETRENVTSLTDESPDAQTLLGDASRVRPCVRGFPPWR